MLLRGLTSAFTTYIWIIILILFVNTSRVAKVKSDAYEGFISA